MENNKISSVKPPPIPPRSPLRPPPPSWPPASPRLQAGHLPRPVIPTVSYPAVPQARSFSPGPFSVSLRPMPHDYPILPPAPTHPPPATPFEPEFSPSPRPRIKFEEPLISKSLPSSSGSKISSYSRSRAKSGHSLKFGSLKPSSESKSGSNKRPRVKPGQSKASDTLSPPFGPSISPNPRPRLRNGETFEHLAPTNRPAKIASSLRPRFPVDLSLIHPTQRPSFEPEASSPPHLPPPGKPIELPRNPPFNDPPKAKAKLKSRPLVQPIPEVDPYQPAPVTPPPPAKTRTPPKSRPVVETVRPELPSPAILLQPPERFKIGRKMRGLLGEAIQISHPEDSDLTLLGITSCNTNSWAITNKITGDKATLDFEHSYKATAKFPNSAYTAPIKLRLSTAAIAAGYTFTSTWRSGRMRWAEGSSSKRRMVTVGGAKEEWVANYTKGWLWEGKRSGRVEVASALLSEGGWKAWDEVVVTGVAVAELMRRRGAGQ